VTPEQFLKFADPLPERMLLLTGSGLVLAGNHAVEQVLGKARSEIRSKHLSDFVSDSPAEIADYLQLCSRSRSLVQGSLTLVTAGGRSAPCRTEGVVIDPMEGDSQAILMLRLTPQEAAVEKFVELNQRMELLNLEIHRRKNAETDALREAARLRVTLHSIGDGVIVTDGEGRVQLINPVAQAMTGWTNDSGIGLPLTQIVNILNEETRKPVENPALRAMKEGVIVGLANQILLLSRDGQEWPVDDSAAPIRDPDGIIIGSVLVFRDIRGRKKNELEIKQSEARFRQLADVVPQIIWTARPDGNIDYLNRQWHTFTGLPQTVGNAGWDQILHPEDKQRAGERWAASVQKGVPFETELRLLDRKRQTYRWHLIRTVAVHDEEGRVVRWVGTSTDIHAQKRAEESSRYLAEASAALARVVDYKSTLQKIANLAVPHFADWSAVDVVNEDGTLERLAVSHEEPEKVKLAHELMRDYPPDPQAPLGGVAVLRSGKPEIVAEISDEMLVKAAKDERHLNLIRSLGLRSYICVPLVVSGNPLGVLTFATAESGRAYNQADLALANDLAYRAGVAIENTQLYQALRDADRRKDEFLATLAHELRNPLAPIRNGLEVLRLAGANSEMAEQSRSMMDRQLNQMVRLVDDLMDVSRITRNKLELRKERVSLATVIKSAVETSLPLIEQAGHWFSLALPSEPIYLDADLTRLAQVFSNLLNNAARYTPAGGTISLTGRIGEGSVEVRVKDNGLGISADALPKVFEMFSQVDSNRERAQGGLGIGLTLVRRLVEMHGGSVEARSEGSGRGSEFIVRLPIVNRADPPILAAADEGLSAKNKRRILVVDDNVDSAMSLRMMLDLLGHESAIAHDGLAALEVAEKFQPDVILLDIGLPTLNGYEVCRRIREQPWSQQMAIIALTGWGQDEDRRRSSEAGFDHHLIKPVERASLEKLLGELAAKASPQRGQTLGKTPLRVLVVDDRRDALYMLQTLLRAEGHEVQTASDGPSALVKANENPPQVILLDIGLPGMSGLEVAKRIRQQTALKDVMLIALTGYGEEADRKRSAEAGFDHHLVKPVDIQTLKKILKTVPSKLNGMS
jgi:PAS domain S-box-containing protein